MKDERAHTRVEISMDRECIERGESARGEIKEKT